MFGRGERGPAREGSASEPRGGVALDSPVRDADAAGARLDRVAALAPGPLQIGLLAALRRKIDTMLWVSLGIIVVFGGATLVLRDETFIKWKPTVLYWLFAAALAGAELLFRRNLIRAMLGAQETMYSCICARRATSSTSEIR